MLVYSASKTNFRDDILTNNIGSIVHEAFRRATGRHTGQSEIESWTNSLRYMDTVLDDDEIPEDAGIAIEYHLPYSRKRVDFIITGRSKDNHESVVLIELKQWTKAEHSDRDAMVFTAFRGARTETVHPSYQAWSYKQLLEDFNQTVRDEAIQLKPCAYLHNYDDDGVINHPDYKQHIANAPLFLRRDAVKLREFIKNHVKYGDNANLMYRIDHGKIKPSKNLADNLASMLSGNDEFILIDDQKVVFEQCMRMIGQPRPERQVFIIEGGPGTGKSVVAINLLVEITRQEKLAKYVTRNSAPRQVYEALLTGTMKKSAISNLFSGSGSFIGTTENEFDCLIVDEAHRLTEKSGMFSNLGESQIREIIAAAKLSIFFVDPNQKVTFKDVGDIPEIRNHAKSLGAKVTQGRLESQFRCNGSDGYLAWLDNTLQISDTANPFLAAEEYDFRIFDSPEELHAEIAKRNESRNKARVVAGYCWNWISKKDPKRKDIKIGTYEATWNLNSDGQAWIIKPDSVSEVGCVHTCQGLELDYVGVIVGDDLIARDTIIITQPENRARTDNSVKGWKKAFKIDPESTRKKLDAIIKNTYRTLMTRGQKGCYVYFTDDETRDYFQSRIDSKKAELKPIDEVISSPTPIQRPLKILADTDAIPYVNCVPLYNLKAAAGGFSGEQHITSPQWVELPVEFRASSELFVVQVDGESMNKRIPNGSWCLFRRIKGGSRSGKVVLAWRSDVTNSDDGGHFTVKIYRSQKIEDQSLQWQHEKIFLEPDSTDPQFETIVLDSANPQSLRIIGELVAVLD